jgi:hypothetical protein
MLGVKIGVAGRATIAIAARFRHIPVDKYLNMEVS